MLRRIALHVFVLTFCGRATLSAQSAGASVRGLLPTGRFAVEVMEPWSPPRLAELTQRLQRAIQADPAWWQEHIRRARPGEPIAYDQRLGLTEPEFREFLLVSESVQMRPARIDTLAVDATDYGWRFADISGPPALRGIEIDTIRGVVRSPFGELQSAEPIMPSAAQRATGQWGGPRWQREDVNTETMTGTSASFSVGRHASGHTVIYYDARRAMNGRSRRVSVCSCGYCGSRLTKV